MNGTGTRRTQAERDATTVEIGYALLTGALQAGVAFALLGMPVLYDRVTGVAADRLLAAAGAVAAVVFLVRVVRVLTRFRQRDPDA
ncbi:DUF6332 family protein [Streptomyces sp. VRA16 Mangrove soil]|uniref:DUF6332 family protein n=1 Tax=Streptomyces sp. VRA16 Mangrove soil TaxID=2817434 RepID=UPI001A9F8558|nr:DUF6332 family protein [Streptomyces sp. VRA16 Mangrove soil]MBO1334484.1 hypothetical protein [Streptomyces sp. VRA16 Mangrove soil]